MILDGLRVVDTSRGLAGAYCAKLLTDLGADVVYPESDDALRRKRPELYAYLRTSQRCAAGAATAALFGTADVVIRQGSASPRPTGPLVTVDVSSFGAGGPDSGDQLPEPVLQARCGALSVHGHMGRTPLTVGGELGEYATGAFAALGAVTAWRRTQRTGVPEIVDVSMLEAMQLTLTSVPTLMARFPGGRTGSFRFVMIPGNERCADGNYAGITTLTKQQWRSLLHVAGRDDLAGDEQLETMLGRFVRAREVREMLESFTSRHPAAEVVERCAAERVPAALVGNGELLPAFDQLAERDVFVAQPGESWIRPRAPFRFSRVDDRVLHPAPVGPAADVEWSGDPRPRRRGAAGERPLAGTFVVDFTAFWSGPFATAWLAAMGAEVVKVESIRRPDGLRFSAAMRPGVDPRWYEMSALHHAANLNKVGITLDLGDPRGLDLVKRLVARADVVAENFTPRVLEGFGLGYDEVAAIRPDVVMLRIPAFGLTGPWRDRPGFAQTMEQLSGMAWVTGYDDGPPIIPGGVVDPMVGVHAALAVMAALEHRDHTGEGQLVEVPMIEVAAAVTAEQVIEHSAHGRIMGRRGEHGVYRCDGDDEWLAVDAASDPMAAEERAAWCRERAAGDAAASLRTEGVAAAAMVPAYLALDDPQLVARGFFEPLEHPVVGRQDYPGFPMRLSGGPQRYWTSAAPTLGQHTDAVLREHLGLDDEELARLAADGVTGTEPVAW
ncbi:MAG: CoA transferase [Acidimicrobiia bacterium]